MRWWDGAAWTDHQTVGRGALRTDPGTGDVRSGHVRALKALICLTLLAVPVNWATIAWANRSSQGVTQCNAAPTWDQSALGTYIPLTFVAVSLGCLIATIMTHRRTRNANPRPIGGGMVVLALIGLISAAVSGFLAAFSVGWINVCF